MNIAQGNISNGRLVVPLTVDKHMTQRGIKGLCSSLLMKHSLKLNIQVLEVLNLLETFIYKHRAVPVQTCIKFKQAKKTHL